MGVPRLSRWMMERFPSCIRTLNDNNLAGRIDDLYIDFNGLIHESLLRGSIVKQYLSEDKVFQQVTAYLLEIILAVKPREMIYIAIDGPAPDAKIRQQRQRRIMGELEGESQNRFREVQKWQDAYEKLNKVTEEYMMQDGTEMPVLQASITPGTPFFRRFSSYLVAWLARMQEGKVLGDNLKIIFSGPNVVGEGEHKIIHAIKKRVNVKNVHQEVAEFCKSQLLGLNVAEMVKADNNIMNVAVVRKVKTQSGRFQFLKQEGQRTVEQEYEEIPQQNVKVKAPIISSDDLDEQRKRRQEFEKQLKTRSETRSSAVFGMDGDLYLLLMALNLPEIYLLRRWQGTVVNDFTVPMYSNLDPLEVGFVYCDIQGMREGIVLEMLANQIKTDEQLLKLLSHEYFKYSYIVTNKNNKLININDQLNYLHSLNNKRAVELQPLLRFFLLQMIVFSKLGNKLTQDFITLTLFVGNDFLPQIPGQSIRDGALDRLIELYQKDFIDIVENEIKIQFLLNDSQQIKFNYLSKLFKVVSDNCELRQMFYDFDDLKKLKLNLETKQYIDPKGIVKKCLRDEWATLENALGSDVVNKINIRNIDKECEPQKYNFINTYKSMYYNKFNFLASVLNHRMTFVPIEKMSPTDMKLLRIYDMMQNDEERKARSIPRDVQNVILKNPTVKHFKQIHYMIRSYLKTLQWVVLYYLSDQGCPQWDWEFPFPFTPLCSDMAIYCKLYEHVDDEIDLNEMDSDDSQMNEKIVQKDTKKQKEEEEQIVEDQKIEATIRELVQRYSGPEFKFIKSQPKSPLEQLIVTTSKSRAYDLLPKFVLENMDLKFFESQKTVDDIIIMDYQSAFLSFNQRLDLSYQSSLGQRTQSTLSYGYHPKYSIYYKNYPVGLVDGVDFSLGKNIKDHLMKICTPEQQKFMKANYTFGSDIYILQDQNSTGILEPKIDKYDIDYEIEYQHPKYSRGQNKKAENHSVKLCLKRLSTNSELKNVRFYSDKPDENSMYLLLNIQMERFKQVEFMTSCPIRIRGAHFIQEQANNYITQLSRLSIVNYQVKGIGLFRDLKIVNNYADNVGDEMRLYEKNENITQDGELEQLLNKISQHLQIEPQILSSCPVLTYQNDSYGYVYGIMYKSKIYLVSKDKPEFYEANQEIKAQLSLNDNFLNQIYQFTSDYNSDCLANNGSDNQPILLMCTKLQISKEDLHNKYSINKVQTNQQLSRQRYHWLSDILITQNKSKQYYFRSELCPYQECLVQPVFLSTLHRRAQRKTLLTHLEQQIKTKYANIFTQSAKYKEILPKIDVNKLKLPEIKLDQKIATLLGLSEEPLNEQELKKHNQHIPTYLEELTSTMPFKLPDMSYRELALNISRNRFYWTRAKSGTVYQFNRLAQIAICIYVSFFQTQLEYLMSKEQQKPEDKIMASLNKPLNIHQRELLPLMTSAMGSYMQAYANVLVTPLVWSCPANHTDEFLFRPILQYAKEALKSILSDNQVQINEELNALQEFQKKFGVQYFNKDVLQLLDLVYSPEIKQVGLVAGIANKNAYVLTTDDIYGNSSMRFGSNSVAKVSLDQLCVLSKCGTKLQDIIYKQAIPPVNKKIKHLESKFSLKFDLNNYIQSNWIVAYDSFLGDNSGKKLESSKPQTINITVEKVQQKPKPNFLIKMQQSSRSEIKLSEQPTKDNSKQDEIIIQDGEIIYQ